MRQIAILLVISLALAGCSGDEPSQDSKLNPAEPSQEDTATTTQTSTAATTSDPSEPSDPEEPAASNEAPTGTLTASISQGEAPVDVMFSLEGSDPDGDNITWTFDADNDGSFEAEGTELPATYNHTYDGVGVFTANFTLSDGARSTSYEAEINATQAVEASPDFEQIVITGSISGYWLPIGLYVTDPNHHDFEVPGVASSIHFRLDFGDTGIDLDYDVFDAAGNAAGDTAQYNDPIQGDGNNYEELTIDDPNVLSSVGTWGLDIYSAGSLATEYTMTITFTA